jgi:hypothetical protein
MNRVDELDPCLSNLVFNEASVDLHKRMHILKMYEGKEKNLRKTLKQKDEGKQTTDKNALKQSFDKKIFIFLPPYEISYIILSCIRINLNFREDQIFVPHIS